MVTQRLTLGIALALSVGSLGACRAQVRASGTAQAEPVLVWVDGVWVVEDYHEPVFYTDSYYWRFYGGVWYRSQSHSSGWIRVDVVPDRVRRIDTPTRYVRWRAEAGARRHKGNTPPPAQPADEPVVDETTPDRGQGPPDHAPAHGVRGTQPGHNKGDDKAEMKEEKAEAKADAKEAKADAKADAKAAKEAEKAAKDQAKADEKAAKEQAKADEKAAKEQAKADAKAAKDAEKAEKAKEKGGGGGADTGGGGGAGKGGGGGKKNP